MSSDNEFLECEPGEILTAVTSWGAVNSVQFVKATPKSVTVRFMGNGRDLTHDYQSDATGRTVTEAVPLTVEDINNPALKTEEIFRLQKNGLFENGSHTEYLAKRATFIEGVPVHVSRWTN